MASIYDLNFQLKVTRVHRKSIDHLIRFANKYESENRERLFGSMESEEEIIDADAFHALFVDTPQIIFSLYALGIVHCYSLVENNRKLICQKIPGLSDGQKRNLHKINVTTQCLGKIGIKHEKIRCFKTMDEFRLVNNAIKHERYGLSTSITTQKQKSYKSKQLRSLYVNRVTHLETYLADLHRRVLKK